MMRRYIYTVLLSVVFAISGYAQDIHFSQFYMSPLNLNPAMTGVMNCNQRFVANFRNQWSSVLKSNAYNTFSASYDRKIPFSRYDYFGIGGTLWGDVAGASRFGTIGGNISGSYSKYLGGNRNFKHYAVLGAEVGFRQRSMRNLVELQFGDQYEVGTGTINPTSPESLNSAFNNDYLFADINAGFLYFAVWDEVNSFWVGGALHHINEPNQSFYRNVTNPNAPQIFSLYSRYTVHGGAEISLNRKFDLLPGFVVLQQGEAFELNAGAAFRTVLSKSRYSYQAVQFGLWTRLANSVGEPAAGGGPATDNTILSDALILSTRFDYDRFGIGFSYDINISSLRAASNGNGAFEFSLIYNLCEQERRNVYCPKF